MEKITVNKKKQFGYGSFYVFLMTVSLVVLTGCSSSDDDDGTAGGSGGSTIESASTDLAYYLTAAINDEYRARDTYLEIINKFGEVRPFPNIMRAEEQHIAMVVNLFNTYGMSVPPDRVGGLPAPASIAAACSLGVQAEIENADLYDELLAGTRAYADVQTVFKSLQSASLNQHLPAFRRCAE